MVHFIYEDRHSMHDHHMHMEALKEVLAWATQKWLQVISNIKQFYH